MNSSTYKTLLEIEKEIIFTDFDYFSNLFSLIDNIMILNSLPILHKQIEEFIPIMKSKSTDIQNESIYFLQRALCECVYIKSSNIFRYLLFHLYNIDYSLLKNDLLIEDCLLDNHEKLKVKPSNLFKDEIKPISNLDEIFIDNKKEIKHIGLFPEHFEDNSYQLDKSLVNDLFINEIVSNKHSISKLDSLLLTFPEYYKIFSKSYNNILHNDKIYLNITERYYLAIMATSIVNCDFLMKDLIKQFLINEGDPNWLKHGLEGAPYKFKALSHLNNILSNKPWTLTTSDLIDAGINKNMKNVISACIILTSFQRLSSILESLHIIIKHPNSFNIKESSINHQQKTKLSGGISKIMKELKKAGDSSSKEKRERSEQLHHLKSLKEKPLPNTNKHNPIYARFHSDYLLIYEDFDYHVDNYLFSYDFSFDSIGFAVLYQYWPEAMTNIRNDFDFIFQFSSFCFGNHEKISSIDYFRWTIVTYVEKLFGLCDETFDYSLTNKLTPRILKTNYKNIACFPNKVDFSLISSNDFGWQDLFHIILLITITKQRIQLTYLAKIVNEIHITNSK